MNDDSTLTPDTETIAPAPQSAHVMLRAVSALGLAIVAFAATWAGALPFSALALIVALVMSWEWSRVVRGDGVDATLIVHALAVAAAVALAAFGFAALGVAALVIGTIIVLALEFGRHPILSATGVLYAGLPAVALIWLRSNEPSGFQSVLFIVLVVAATDTLAFVAGRTLGGPKLAPSVSPNKTWSGLIGGVLGAALTAGLFAYAISAPIAALAVIGLGMGLIAQLGDLAESAMKRAFHVKDVSQLLPGHGGFMDRMDGLVPVAVALALAALFIDPQAPAAALLAGFMPGTP